MRPSRPLAGLVLLAAIAAGLVATAPPAGAAPALVWERGGIGLVRESSPLAAHLDGDAVDDIVVGAHDGRVWAVRGTTGGDAPGWPRQTSHAINSSPSAADVDGDRRPELFVGSGTAGVVGGALYSFQHDGATRFRLEASDRVFGNPSIHSTPAVGDVTGEGDPDVVFGSLGLESVWAVASDGVRHRGFPFYADDTTFSSPALVDVNGDRVRDIIIGSDSSAGPPVDHQGGIVRAIDGRNGGQIWEFRINDIARSSPSVGDIDGDGRLDVVFGADDHFGGDDHRRVFALTLQGTLKPGWPQVTDGTTMGSPALADLNGDGRLDVVTGTAGRGGSVYAWDGTGRPLPGFPRSSGAGVVIGSVTTADLDGDGAQDVLVPTGGAVFAYRGRDGQRLFSLAEGKGLSFQSSPLVKDLDGNGRLDVVIAGGRGDGSGAILRYELDAVARLGPRGWPEFRGGGDRTGVWRPSPVTPRAIDDSCPAGRVPEDGFADVPPSNVHEAAVDCIVWWQIAQGSGSAYNPAAIVTREQMAAFIARTIERSGGTLPANPDDAFPDDEDSVHELRINQLAAVGVVNGLADGSYGPKRAVTRGQMATFLARAYQERTGRVLPATTDWFPDDGGSVHQGSINRMAEARIAAGTASGRFLPDSPVKRDAMASFVARLLDLLVEERHTTPPGRSPSG